MLRPSQVARLVRLARSGSEPQRWTMRMVRQSAAATSTISMVMTTRPLSSVSATHWRQYHSTPRLLEDKEAAAEGEEEDFIPPWQNPLHHNNPDYQKIFEEDFEEGEEMVPLPLPPFEEEPGKTLAPPHIHDLAHQIVNLTMLEMKELTVRISDHFGFDDQMRAASYGGGGEMGAGAGGAQEEEAQAEEKTIFDVKLVGFDAKAKIKVIKEIRAITGLGLKEAKELVESAPKVVQKELKQEKADELKSQLEAVGAQVELV